jgi:TatD DNase family protein
MYVDSHCHIDFPDYDEDRAAMLDRMQAAKVTHALCIGVNMRDAKRVIQLAEKNANLYASVGVHPDHDEDEVPSVADLIALADHDKVIAIGETGLDYFRLPEGKEQETIATQQQKFITHISASRQTEKPLIIHTRQASEDTIDLMKAHYAAEEGGVMHCFTESWQVAKAALDLNFYISFSGIITFKNAADLREVVAQVPLDRLLIETDSPYLAPMPHRGKRNEPTWVSHVAECVATIKGLPVESVAVATKQNFQNLFKVQI